MAIEWESEVVLRVANALTAAQRALDEILTEDEVRITTVRVVDVGDCTVAIEARPVHSGRSMAGTSPLPGQRPLPIKEEAFACRCAGKSTRAARMVFQPA